MTPCGPFQLDPFCDNSYLCKSGQPARVRSDPGRARPAAGGAAQPAPAAVAPDKPRPFLAAPAAEGGGRGGAGRGQRWAAPSSGGAGWTGGERQESGGGSAAGRRRRPEDRMVFESLVVDVLNRFLGDYVVNLDSSQLKLGIWGGTGLARRGGAACLPSCRRVPSCPAGLALPPAQGRRPGRRPLGAAGSGRPRTRQLCRRSTCPAA